MAETKVPTKFKIGEFQTPIGPFVWPKLTEPDTKFKAEGVYSTKIKYDGSTADVMRPKLLAFLEQAFAEYKKKIEDKKVLKVLKKADLPLKPELDEEGEETGNFLLNTKRNASGISKKTGKEWKATIPIADSKGKLVKKKDLNIWSGTEGRVKCDVMAWYGAKDKEVGITLEITGVQIKKLVSGTGRDPNFDELEDGGWTAEDDADGFDADADDTADTADDDGSSDF